MKKPKTVLVLRVNNPDMTSHGGFLYPESGVVSAPDWDPKPECGKGLHGWLWGEGNSFAADDKCSLKDAKWLVLKVSSKDVVDLSGKVKFPSGTVVHCGDRKSATDYLYKHGAKGAVIGGMLTVGDHSFATVGDHGTATAGNFGTATAGNFGTATAGYKGTATAGRYGTAKAGDNGKLIISYFDNRSRIATAYVGENGIKSNVAYILDENGTFKEKV